MKPNKTIAIYALQVLLAAMAVAGGVAMISGAAPMVQSFQPFGLGQGFLPFAGCIEIVAGLFMLLPRGGAVGAALLGCLMLATLGVTLGHGASPRDGSSGPSLLQAGRTAEGDSPVGPLVRTVREWDI